MNFKLGNRDFKSKIDLVFFLQSILKNAKLKGPSDIFFPKSQNILKALFAFYPLVKSDNSVLKKVFRIAVVYNGNAKCFCAVFYDNSLINFSYNRCIMEMQEFNNSRLCKILRDKINSFCKKFKAKMLDGKGYGICSYSGLKFTAEDLSVEHNPPFNQLVHAFLVIKGVDLEDININDSNFLNDFKEYHSKKAKLFLVSRELNSSLGSVDVNSIAGQIIVKRFIVKHQINNFKN